MIAHSDIAVAADKTAVGLIDIAVAEIAAVSASAVVGRMFATAAAEAASVS